MLILQGFALAFFIVARREFKECIRAGTVLCAIFLHSDVIGKPPELLIDIAAPPWLYPRGRRGFLKLFFYLSIF